MSRPQRSRRGAAARADLGDGGRPAARPRRSGDPGPVPAGGLPRTPREHDEVGSADRSARATTWLEPTPSELAGLAVLVLGAVAATTLLWMQASRRPTGLRDAAAAAAVVGGVLPLMSATG